MINYNEDHWYLCYDLKCKLDIKIFPDTQTLVKHSKCTHISMEDLLIQIQNPDLPFNKIQAQIEESEEIFKKKIKSLQARFEDFIKNIITANQQVFQAKYHPEKPNSGYGGYQYRDGEVYKGLWKNGNFEDGEKEGQGVFTDVNGYQIDQEWKDGEYIKDTPRK